MKNVDAFLHLALVGSGEYLPPMEAVDRELISRLDDPPRVVCLPTAAGTEGEERVNYWMQLGLQHFIRLGADVQSLPIIDRASANNLEYAEIIARSNFVYLSGGKPDYLYNTLNDTAAWHAIAGVLGDGGLLAGCSAGAMIMGEKFYGFPGLKPGFGFLKHALIMPHFDEIPDSMIKSLRFLMTRDLTLLGVEGNTALVSGDGQYEVVGSGGVTLWNRDGKQRYTHGQILPDWTK